MFVGNFEGKKFDVLRVIFVLHFLLYFLLSRYLTKISIGKNYTPLVSDDDRKLEFTYEDRK